MTFAKKYHGFNGVQSNEFGDDVDGLDVIYANIMQNVIARGGDTDTNACIVGGVVGAFIGLNNLPKKLDSVHRNWIILKGKNRKIIKLDFVLMKILFWQERNFLPTTTFGKKWGKKKELN